MRPAYRLIYLTAALFAGVGVGEWQYNTHQSYVTLAVAVFFAVLPFLGGRLARFIGRRMTERDILTDVASGQMSPEDAHVALANARKDTFEDP